MSDLFPQPQPQPQPRMPARNMADIARMFLDGVRQAPESGGPKRMSPKERMESERMPSSAVASEEAPLELPRVMLAFTGGEESRERMAAAAGKWAKTHRATIGVLLLRGTKMSVEVFGVQAGIELPEVKGGAGMADVLVARALFTLRHEVSHWVIGATDTDMPEFPRLAAAIGDWVVITPIGNDHVVAAYQELKRALAISSPVNEPMAVMLSADGAGAGIVHGRLRRAAAEFLKKDLRLAAVTPASCAGGVEVCAIEVGEEDRAGVFAAVLDELCGTVSETEEEAAEEVEAEFEDEVVEVPEGLPVQTSGTEEEDFGGPLAQAEFEEAAGQHSIDVDGPLDAATAAAVDLALNADSAASSSSALFDHLTNVLDPEERDALSAELFGGDEATPSPVVAGSASPAAAATTDAGFILAERQPEGCTLYTRVPTSVSSADSSTGNAGFTLEQPKGCTPSAAATAPAQTASEHLTLRIHNLVGAPDRSRSAQWQAVLRAIPDLSSKAILLDAKAPMVWAEESALTLMPDGSLHVWMLEGEGGSWFALKEWAGEHLRLLALTYRTLLVDLEAAITVHLVLPLKETGSGESPALLRTGSAHLQLYRLHPLQWNTQHGIIVVPLA